MNARLMAFLRGIEQIPDQVDQAVDRGINSFCLSPGLITDWIAFRRLIVRFYVHMEGALLGLSRPRPPNEWMDVAQCLRLLTNDFGEHCLANAFDMARDGTRGGLPRVIRALACVQGNAHAEEQVAIAVSLYWDTRSPEQLVADAWEYVQHYGHLLPAGLIDGRFPRGLVHYRKILKEHPAQMQTIRNEMRIPSG